MASLVLAALFTLVSSQQLDLTSVPTSNALEWHPCYDKFQCARLSAPLDYEKPNGTQTSIPLVKYAAQPNSTDGSYQGMLVMNPGGPGGMGTTLITQGGADIQLIVGSNWDIVSFDPRGVGYASPSTNCSDVTPDGSLQARSITASQPDSFFNDSLATAQRIGEQCKDKIGDVGQYVNTYYVAHDLATIVDAFAATTEGQSVPKVLNYWGLSYGTMLGMAYASMFPDKVGKLVLDGNVDPTDYLSGEVKLSIYNADQTMEQFSRFCQLAGSSCSFYTNPSVQARFENLINHLDARTAAANGWSNATEISLALAALGEIITAALVTPLQAFPALADVLTAVEPVVLGNFSALSFAAALQNATGPEESYPAQMASRAEWGTSVFCTEANNTVYGSSLSDLQPYIDTIHNQSALEYAVYVRDYRIQCARWPIKSIKQLDPTSIGSHEAAPIQFVGNTLDSETPLKNARTNAKLFDNSGVLVVDAMGHTSLLARNTCAYKAIREYLTTGQPSNAYCSFETAPFGVTSVTMLVGNSTTTSGNASTTSSAAQTSTAYSSAATVMIDYQGFSCAAIAIAIIGFLTF